MDTPTQALLLWVVTVNLLAFLTFGWDKRAARLERKRVSEAHLLWLTFLLGAPGALLAMRVFRHKTSKRSFRVRFVAVIALELVLVGAALWFLVLRDLYAPAA